MCAMTCCKGHISSTVPCNTSITADKPAGFFKRTARTIRPLLPAFLLALVPKCPFCLAAYVALGTGIGLSVTSAVYLHIFLLCATVIPLSLFAANYISTKLYAAQLYKRHLFTGMLGVLIGCSILWLF